LSTDVTYQPSPTGPTAEVFWRPGCPYCDALRSDLARRGITAVWRDIWSDGDARAFVRSVNRGNETVPTVRIGDRTMTNPTGAQVSEQLNAAEDPAGG
jgi:mycoredoxin